jgi:hypothetical protein
MVRIDPPPPKRSAQPVIHTLPAGERLLRIYDPGEWNNTALSFRRSGGPRLRFDHHLSPDDESRGIHYSAPTLEACVVEVFGDDGLISTGSRRLGSLLLQRSFRLLDLRGDGAWQAGATAAICSSPYHRNSQLRFSALQPRQRPLATAIQLIQQGSGARESRGREKREAADRLGGIEITAHQQRQVLAGPLELRRNHRDHLLQPLPQQGISQIGLGLRQIGDAIALRHGRVAESAQLGQYEPDPVSLLGTGLQLPQRLGIDAPVALTLGRVEPL